jgi:hypothetical protein
MLKNKLFQYLNAGKSSRNTSFDTGQSMLLILIYLSTAIGLPPSGSGTVHIYTQTIHKTTQQQSNTNNKQNNIKQQIWKSAGRAQSLRVLPWHSPYN